jgi:hypothetical protein
LSGTSLICMPCFCRLSRKQTACRRNHQSIQISRDAYRCRKTKIPRSDIRNYNGCNRQTKDCFFKT